MRTTRTSLLVAALASGLLAGSAVGAAAQDKPEALQLVTEEVEPGVERIISDGAGHDLDETHPTNRYDMDAIGITPDGTVWLATTHSGSDNPGEAHLIGLGRPGTYPRAAFVDNLITLADGTLLATTDEGIRRFDGERWVADDGPRLRPTADGGLLLLLEGADLADELSQGQVADFPDLHAYWGGGWGWAPLHELGRTGVNTGLYWCWLDEGTGWGEGLRGVGCARGRDGWTTGVESAYLEGTYVHHLAAAPDGSVWAVGEYDGGPGGVYRITLPEPDAE